MLELFSSIFSIFGFIFLFDIAGLLFLDIVICIKKEDVHVYCNPDNYYLMMSYAASWDNLVIHCLDENQVSSFDYEKMDSIFL